MIALLIGACQSTFAQDSEDQRGLNIAYAAVIGSGVYFLDGSTVAVLRVPFRKTLKAPEVGRWGTRLTLPVTLGYHQFDSDFYPSNNDSVASMSFVPGFEFNYLVNPNWAIKPFVSAGAGVNFDDGSTDLIWATGIRTRADVRFGTPRITLGAELLYAAHNGPDENTSDNFSRLAVGIDFQFPLSMTIGTRRTSLTTHLIGYDYIKELEFQPEVGDPFKIGSAVEVGVAIGLDPPLSIFGFTLDRVGLGYRYGNDQKAIVLVRKFPF
jgi:hypothetical protein